MVQNLGFILLSLEHYILNLKINTCVIFLANFKKFLKDSLFGHIGEYV